MENPEITKFLLFILFLAVPVMIIVLSWAWGDISRLNRKVESLEYAARRTENSIQLMALQLKPHKLGDAVPSPPAPPSGRVIREGHEPPKPPTRKERNT